MSNANKESIKEVLRWVVLFIISWIITQLLSQTDLVPESWLLKVYVFSFSIPVRTLFVYLLTLAGRYIDKYLHVNKKDNRTYPVGMTPAGGLLPF